MISIYSVGRKLASSLALILTILSRRLGRRILLSLERAGQSRRTKNSLRLFSVLIRIGRKIDRRTPTEPPWRLRPPISSGGCRHYGRGGRPPVGCPQANGVQARYQPAGGLARKLSVSSWRTSTLQGGPASRLPPRSSMETTSYGGPIRFTRQADHHQAVPSGKAQRRLEGPPSATVGSSIPFATSRRHRRRQQRAKGEVAVGATGEAIAESAAIMLKSRPTWTRRWSRPPSVEPPRSVRPTDWYVPRLWLQHGYQRETTPAHLSRALDKKHRDDAAPLPRLIACLRRAGGRGVFDDWQRTTK